MEILYINPLLKKKPWRRLANRDTASIDIADAEYYDIPVEQPNGLNYQYLGNAELLNESCEGAHLVNSNIFSLRPICEIVKREIEVIDENGEKQKKTIEEEVVVGYDKVETVRSGLPEMIIKQKTSHLTKNGIEIADEGGIDHEGYDEFLAWKDMSGVDSGYSEMVYAAGKCGDAAIYIYQRGKNDIEYTVFSMLEGSMLFPHKDEKGNDFLVRKYMLRGREMVDIFTADEKSTWVRGDISKEDNAATGVVSWLSKVIGWFKNFSFATAVVSKDGWTRVDYVVSQLSNKIPQFAYLRFDDSFIGGAMQNINAFDRCLSYVSDKMRSTAFAKFFAKATKFKNLPPLSSGEEVIGVENADVEALKAADAKYITPPDISDIATINLKNIFDAIMQSTMSIDLQPEILKSGADSSQTLKLLLRREIQWCHVMWPQVRPVAKQIINILKALVDKIEQGGGRYSKLRISVWNTPWLPQDEDALAERINKYIYNGVMSAESGRHESGMRYTNDAAQIAKEQEEKIYRETYIKLKAEAEARKKFGPEDTAEDVVVDKVEDNPSKDEAKPKIDNNAPYKKMAEGKINN